jgi:hypothetical protein
MALRIRGSHDERQQIETAFLIALGRKPDNDEVAWSRGLLKRQSKPGEALTHLCHMLLNTSEFLYVP